MLMPLLLCARRGRLERVEHVDNARRSAQHVARILLKQADADAPYDYLCAALLLR
jgi:hypothetical protein